MFVRDVLLRGREKQGLHFFFGGGRGYDVSVCCFDANEHRRPVIYSYAGFSVLWVRVFFLLLPLNYFLHEYE